MNYKIITMIATNQTVETLDSLVKINNDRVQGYEKAAEQLKNEDADLHSLFIKMAGDSRNYSAKLNNLLMQYGEEAQTDSTAPGKIYRTWMGIKNAFTGSDRKSVLESCEYGEDAAQKAYKEALEDMNDGEGELNVQVKQLIVEQQRELKVAHDKIRQLRDSL